MHKHTLTSCLLISELRSAPIFSLDVKQVVVEWIHWHSFSFLSLWHKHTHWVCNQTEVVVCERHVQNQTIVWQLYHRPVSLFWSYFGGKRSRVQALLFFSCSPNPLLLGGKCSQRTSSATFKDNVVSNKAEPWRLELLLAVAEPPSRHPSKNFNLSLHVWSAWRYGCWPVFNWDRVGAEEWAAD